MSVDKIHGGDRAGICVTQFDPKLLERGLVGPTNNVSLMTVTPCFSVPFQVCTPGSVPSTWAVLASMERIQFFKGEVWKKNGQKLT